MLHLLSLHVAIATRQMMHPQNNHNHSHVTSDPWPSKNGLGEIQCKSTWNAISNVVCFMILNIISILQNVADQLWSTAYTQTVTKPIPKWLRAETNTNKQKKHQIQTQTPNTLLFVMNLKSSNLTGATDSNYSGESF